MFIIININDQFPSQKRHSLNMQSDVGVDFFSLKKNYLLKVYWFANDILIWFLNINYDYKCTFNVNLDYVFL